jgi:hypothetical protein
MSLLLLLLGRSPEDYVRLRVFSSLVFIYHLSDHQPLYGYKQVLWACAPTELVYERRGQFLFSEEQALGMAQLVSETLLPVGAN